MAATSIISCLAWRARYYEDSEYQEHRADESLAQHVGDERADVSIWVEPIAMCNETTIGILMHMNAASIGERVHPVRALPVGYRELDRAETRTDRMR